MHASVFAAGGADMAAEGNNPNNPGQTTQWRHDLLPVGLLEDRRTPSFTADTTPPALRNNHVATVWARVEVEAGAVVFTEDEPPWGCTATAGDTVVIIPGRAHRVDPSSDARFAVQFYTAAEGRGS